MFEITKALCDSFLKKGLNGYDLAVYKDGRPILRYMNGYSDKDGKKPVCGNEKNNIFSCSKPITCTAVMQLYEKGLFSLDDNIADYLPEFADMTVMTENGPVPAKNPIKIHHLFEMTAGITRDRRNPSYLKGMEETGGRCPTREMMKYLAKEPLAFEPGDRWMYGLCHDVLAALLEVITGENFNDYVQKNICAPLGIKSITYNLPESERDTVADLLRFNAETGKSEYVGKSAPYYLVGSEYSSGGAGAVSTVDDYIKFLEGFRTYKLLNRETVDLMMTDRLNDYQKREYTSRRLCGYGLGARSPKAGTIYNEYGWGGAAASSASVDIKRGLSIFYSAHQFLSPVLSCHFAIYRLILAEYFKTEDVQNIFDDLAKYQKYDFKY